MMSIANHFVIAAFVAAAPLAASASTFTTLYTFAGKKDGGYPSGPIILRSGDIYGTTIGGSGNVYKVNAANGDFKVVYRFKGGTDGASAGGGVIYQDGMFYGTTWFGGGGCEVNGHPEGCGTIFSINAETGIETVIHSFSQDLNYAGPVGAGTLIYQGGSLYGTAMLAGVNSEGTVFSFNLGTGAFAALHNFGGGTDGVNPNPQLLYQNGLFYGTTLYGGSGHCNFRGCGTLFGIDPETDNETVLYNFSEKKRGVVPYSNIIYHGGSFVGSTGNGGSKACKHGCGVIYKVKAATGHEAVIDELQSSDYVLGITLAGGNAYESVPFGGNGAGELVELDLKSGQQTVLYTFTGGTDGSDPQAPLTYHNGAFYGTTIGGNGTVFKFVP